MSVKMKGGGGERGTGGVAVPLPFPSPPLSLFPPLGVLRQSYIASEFISMNLHFKRRIIPPGLVTHLFSSSLPPSLPYFYRVPY